MPRKPEPNWIVRSQSEQDRLSSEQVTSLARITNLAESDLRLLSQTLAYPLSDQFLPLGAIKPLKQRAKGPLELEKLINELRQAEARLKRAATVYSQLQVLFPAIERGISDPNITYRMDLDMALRSVKRINRSLARSSKRYQSFFTGDPDKRLQRDERRSAVLSVIFDTWHAAGRKVTISTIASTSERTGPLVDFTNAVVRCVTDPATDLNGETIWSEIKEWRRRQMIKNSSVLTTDN